MNATSQVVVNTLREVDVDLAEPAAAPPLERFLRPAGLIADDLVELAALEVAREWSGELARP